MTVTKGGYLRGNKLYRTSKTIRQEVTTLRTIYIKRIKCTYILLYLRTKHTYILSYYYGEELYI